MAAFLAFRGSPAPSMLPTLIPIAIPMPNGTYNNNNITIITTTVT